MPAEFSASDINSSLNQDPSQTFLRRVSAERYTGQAIGIITDLKAFPYFKGHKFGGEIIVPGVTQVKMITDLARIWAIRFFNR